MGLPSHTKYLVIGAGIHGLSTAYHLATQLKERGQGEGKDILVVDKKDIGAFSPDNFPVFDVFRRNCNIFADANHGHEMIGVGELVAQEVLGGTSELLEPSRFSRYETGKLHPSSHSPFPWSQDKTKRA